jgi:endothelin-converting enzyme
MVDEIDIFLSGSLYIKAVFGEKDRQQANELITNIRQMFDENLNKLEWIDEQSKIEAKKKLKKITEKVGYPDFINNKTKLNERFVNELKIQKSKVFFVIVILVIL